MGNEGPERQPDVDAEFARIVAGWSEVAATSGSSGLPPPPVGTGAPAGPPSGPAQPPADARGAHTGADHDGADADVTEVAPESSAASLDPGPTEPSPPWRGYLPEEPDEHFEPPEPHLPPAHDATYWLAVLGLVGGPLLVLWAVLFSGNADPGWSVVAGISLTVAGFGLLVLRGSGGRDPDDDGSRV